MTDTGEIASGRYRVRFASRWFLVTGSACLLLVAMLVGRRPPRHWHLLHLLWVSVFLIVGWQMRRGRRGAIQTARGICLVLATFGLALAFTAIGSRRFGDSDRPMGEIRLLASGTFLLALFGIPLAVVGHPSVDVAFPTPEKALMEKIRTARKRLEEKEGAAETPETDDADAPGQ
ncbi:MAG TPA: hypothetical protein VMX57_09225 [Planctomycetota bacterium]|nr:hypothetical protein [Planctomycetota bacterium]